MKAKILFSVLATVLAVPAMARTPIVMENYVLVADPANVNPQCMRATRLRMDYIRSMAHLADYVQGVCEIRIVPNPRTYALRSPAERDGCGSYHWFGTRQTRGGLARIEITDHRARKCKDIVPAELVVTETYPTGAVRTLYSLPRYRPY